ncbi:hypothetical protein [Streptomyces camelliae]|uniref:Lipoprotein n=1 Tax=Streptomyces camelliae TaxID=3004093 RepID=A0ABY7P2G7_9ACTN|nr:hypothetical protein [Streptomyces sp. HUAS 2-6]WBO64726.1 hypothetical protein O1G22_18730 [Streptomyces sp. HUAS 2-6]
MRTAAVAVGVVGALAALTACSGGGSDKTAAKTTPSATRPATSASGSATPSGASGKLQGSWLTTSGGKIVALVISGKKAGLFVTGEKVWCQGVARVETGMQMIHLTCPGGNKERVTGMVDSVDAKSLKVTWSGKTGQETYSRADGGTLPSARPTHLKKK